MYIYIYIYNGYDTFLPVCCANLFFIILLQIREDFVPLTKCAFKLPCAIALIMPEIIKCNPQGMT